MATGRTYLCIDLKSFYASVECADRSLDPFTTNLVVADPERSRTTICLAVTPAMKALGVKSRCRVFEIPAGIDYIMARPRMRRYMEVSAEIYGIYLRYVSPDDVHVYSIDECFIDATSYLSFYGTDARTFARMLMDAVFEKTHVRATAGMGTNLFLAKVALDVTAKHAPDGIGWLDEDAFKREIWFRRPLTDIWNIGPGIAARLAKHGARDLASVAALRKDVLYREFGANAEFLIDHAWGQEPCTIADIHAYQPRRRSLVNGQVLPKNYTFEEARMVLREMAEESILELVEHGLVAERISLSVGYARPKDNPRAAKDERDDRAPKEKRAEGLTGGERKLDRRTNSARLLTARLERLFDETTRRDLPIRRLSIGFEGLLPESAATTTLFDDVDAEEKERRLQKTLAAVRGKFGKNALLKAANYQEKSTRRERNLQVGGHHA